jgi:transposase-like protein
MGCFRLASSKAWTCSSLNACSADPCLADHLGYDKHAVEGRTGGNSCNGYRAKTMTTDIGPLTVEAPRDRGPC